MRSSYEYVFCIRIAQLNESRTKHPHYYMASVHNCDPIGRLAGCVSPYHMSSKSTWASSPCH